MNYSCKIGEIDIIAKDKDYLVFAEVKYRKNSSVFNPFEAVDTKKQLRIKNTAKSYLYEKKIGFDVKIRFDVIGMNDTKTEIIKNAF